METAEEEPHGVYYHQPLVGIPLGDSIIDGLTIAHGQLADMVQQAIEEQSTIGWEKLLLGMGTMAWQQIQELVDSNNPQRPQRTSMSWMQNAIHQMLKFSLRCWKERNNKIHGSTKQEKKTLALKAAWQKIKELYAQPPTLAPQFGSIFAIPLEHRLILPLQAAEQWLSMVAHQIRVTQHNFTMLLRQHKPMQSHLRTMRREARAQAKDQRQPDTPRKAHGRAVQAAVKEMRDKLYAKKREKGQRSLKQLNRSASAEASTCRQGRSCSIVRPPPRHHPR